LLAGHAAGGRAPLRGRSRRRHGDPQRHRGTRVAGAGGRDRARP
jgi:hypothetical protein